MSVFVYSNRPWDEMDPAATSLPSDCIRSLLGLMKQEHFFSPLILLNKFMPNSLGLENYLIM